MHNAIWVVLCSSVLVLFWAYYFPKSLDSRDMHGNKTMGLLYMAPFLSGGGYSSESLAIAFGLYDYYPKLRMQVIQHGDIVNQNFLRGFSQTYYKKVDDMFLGRHAVFPPATRWDDLLVVICHSEPGAWHPPLYQTLECPPRVDRLPVGQRYDLNVTKVFKIGRTMFEMDGIPNGWNARCNNMDEVWVPTKWSYDVFLKSGVEESKLRIVPEPVDVDFYSPEGIGPLFNNEYETKFLSVFKWETRKGWDILLRAYFTEFRGSKGVVLYVVTAAYHSKRSFAQIIKEYSTLHFPNVTDLPPVVLKTDISTPDMPRLYRSVDCLVIPSRGEGWGRPHVEAMSMGLPIIATNWSGNTEFMTQENSYLLPINGLIDIQDGHWKGSGMKWADPSTTELSKLMRHVHENPDLAKGKGIQARRDMIERYHPKVVSDLIHRELKRIGRINGVEL